MLIKPVWLRQMKDLSYIALARASLQRKWITFIFHILHVKFRSFDHEIQKLFKFVEFGFQHI